MQVNKILSEVVEKADKSRGLRDFSHVTINILSSLCNNYLTEENRDGILTHGCFHKPEEKGIDESLIWGDYYFIEAIMKMRQEV